MRVMLMLAAMSVPAVGQSFRVLPPLDPTAKPAASLGSGVSSDGKTVVGTSYVEIGDGTQARAFLWQAGTGMKDLGIPAFALDASSGARVSDDGSVVVGTNGFTITGFYEPRNAVRWTDATGSPTATVYDEAYFGADVSADGSVMVGTMRLAGSPFPIMDQAYRWTQASGFERLGLLEGGSYSAAAACSADASVIVGFGDHDAGTITAMMWTESGGMTPIPGLALGTPSQANGVSSDGRFVCGYWGDSLFRYEAGVGAQLLGQLPGGGFIDGLDISGDGSVIVGHTDSPDGFLATIWTESGGVQTLSDYAAGFGLDLSGWTLLSASGVSDDGRTIVGTALNPSGSLRAFVLHVPGPGGLAVAVAGGVFALRRRR